MSKKQKNASFEKWIDHVFNHEVRDPQWHWDSDADRIDLNPRLTALFLTRLFNETRTILAPFSKGQVDQGIWYIVFPGASDYALSMVHPTAPWPIRKTAIQSIFSLFAQYFNKNCDAILFHRLRTGAGRDHAPNLSCYMFWDLCWLYGKQADPYAMENDNIVLSVMQDILSLDNVACQESALHGLGHWHDKYPEQTENIVQYFLKQNPHASAELVTYAKSAIQGLVQ